jgi:hypothetical protein
LDPAYDDDAAKEEIQDDDLLQPTDAVATAGMNTARQLKMVKGGKPNMNDNQNDMTG